MAKVIVCEPEEGARLWALRNSLSFDGNLDVFDLIFYFFYLYIDENDTDNENVKRYKHACVAIIADLWIIFMYFFNEKEEKNRTKPIGLNPYNVNK